MDRGDDADDRAEKGQHPGGQDNNEELQGGGVIEQYRRELGLNLEKD